MIQWLMQKEHSAISTFCKSKIRTNSKDDEQMNWNRCSVNRKNDLDLRKKNNRIKQDVDAYNIRSAGAHKWG